MPELILTNVRKNYNDFPLQYMVANQDPAYDKRWKPLPDFKVFDPSQSKNVHYGENNFYLDDINILKANTTHALQDQPYNDFYRVSRRVAGGNQISVDFDLVAHTWRMTQTPFKSVVWSPEMNSMVPNLCDSALIKNGTWNQVSEASPHSRIPELNLQIPNCKFTTSSREPHEVLLTCEIIRPLFPPPLQVPIFHEDLPNR